MKNFYYLHLSKTSGRFFAEYVLDDLIIAARKQKNGVKYLFPKIPVNRWTHNGWHDLISDETYLICSFRDPVEVTVSYFLHHSKITNKELFLNWAAMHDNLQSKGLVKWEDNIVDHTAKIDFDKELILSRLNRINLVLDSKDINIKNCNKIKEKIADDISMPFVSYLEKKDTLCFKTNGAQEFYESLTKEEIDRIKEINYMDVELYEAAKNLFYPM